MRAWVAGKLQVAARWRTWPWRVIAGAVALVIFAEDYYSLRLQSESAETVAEQGYLNASDNAAKIRRMEAELEEASDRIRNLEITLRYR